MDSHWHLIVVLSLFLGGITSGWLIDLDHQGASLKTKWRYFCNPPPCYEDEGLTRGIFHNPRVAFPIIAFTFAFSVMYLIHIIMDYVMFD